MVDKGKQRRQHGKTLRPGGRSQPDSEVLAGLLVKRMVARLLAIVRGVPLSCKRNNKIRI